MFQVEHWHKLGRICSRRFRKCLGNQGDFAALGNHGAPIPDLPRQGLCKLATGCHQSGYPWARVRRRESPDLPRQGLSKLATGWRRRCLPVDSGVLTSGLPRQGLCKLATRLAPKAATRGPGCVGVPNPRAASRPSRNAAKTFWALAKPGIAGVIASRGDCVPSGL